VSFCLVSFFYVMFLLISVTPLAVAKAAARHLT
jgi:hypothetical protein